MAASSNAALPMPVAMMPGATALTVMPRLATSRLSALVAACSAPFAAA